MTRKEYIESELNKYKEVYEINFQEEFDLKAMLDLQYQFMITPRESIKTIGDIIHTKNQIMKNLNLKPKEKPSTYKQTVLIKTNSEGVQSDLNKLLSALIPKNELVKANIGHYRSEFETTSTKIILANSESVSIRGIKADNMYSISEIHQGRPTV